MVATGGDPALVGLHAGLSMSLMAMPAPASSRTLAHASMVRSHPIRNAAGCAGNCAESAAPAGLLAPSRESAPASGNCGISRRDPETVDGTLARTRGASIDVHPRREVLAELNREEVAGDAADAPRPRGTVPCGARGDAVARGDGAAAAPGVLRSVPLPNGDSLRAAPLERIKNCAMSGWLWVRMGFLATSLRGLASM